VNFRDNQFPDKDVKALRELLERFKPETVVEIGTFTGKSAFTILPYVKSLVCVDWFKGNPTVRGGLTKVYEEEDVLSIFKENLSSQEGKEKLTLMVMTSEEAVKSFEDHSLDMVFIDSDHRYSMVKKDIEMWLPKVKKGGVLCGHDFDQFLNEFKEEGDLEQDTSGGLHYGLIKAVCEKFPNVNKLRRIWYVQT